MKLSRKSLILIISSTMSFGIILSSILFFFNRDNTCNCNQDTSRTGTADKISANSKASDISVLGNINSPVTIIEFYDFLCPYCQKTSEMLKLILSEYEDKVKLVFINYPLDKECNKNIKTRMHDGACLLAKGAICASQQNRFSEYQDAAFAIGKRNFSTSEMRQLAILSGLDISAFNECLADKKTISKLLEQLNIAYARDIQSVPAIFINEKKVNDIKDKNLIMNMIENELKKMDK